jgi:hypothetical protein
MSGQRGYFRVGMSVCQRSRLMLSEIMESLNAKSSR